MGRMGKVTVAGLLWVGTLAMGSLEIYSDGVKYRYVPVDDYVGFVRDASARCGEREISLVGGRSCPEARRLCKEKRNLEELALRLRSVTASQRMLESWIQSAKPSNLDAAKWISAAEKMGKRHAEWEEKAKELDRTLASARKRFLRQVSSPEPLFLSRLCKNELELTLPAGVIDVSLVNVADLMPQKIAVTSYLALRNHSGVDISSKDARVYARSFRRHLRPVPFRPWIVEPKTKKLSRSKGGMDRMTAELEAAPALSLREAKRLGYRNYAVGRVELPSDGEEVRVKVDGYEVPRRCEEISYPWRSPSVYVACRFTPKGAVESDRWILRKGRRVLSENAYGEYEGKRYLLFVDRDDAVSVRRKPLAEQERSSGIFGGKIRRKDGYLLTLVNRSEKQKTVKIVERIPRSVTDKIRVKLLKIEGAVEESLDEEGKLVMQAVLPPQSSKEVKVLFELLYDKDLKIRY